MGICDAYYKYFIGGISVKTNMQFNKEGNCLGFGIAFAKKYHVENIGITKKGYENKKEFQAFLNGLRDDAMRYEIVYLHYYGCMCEYNELVSTASYSGFFAVNTDYLDENRLVSSVFSFEKVEMLKKKMFDYFSSTQGEYCLFGGYHIDTSKEPAVKTGHSILIFKAKTLIRAFDSNIGVSDEITNDLSNFIISLGNCYQANTLELFFLG